MTAEVAILNKSGVALAADSAVSIGQAADKIWTSAEKVFQLSEADPVGIMIYGNADFQGLPWETLIKTYRRERGGQSHTHLEDHSKAFLKFLSTTKSISPKMDQLKTKELAHIALSSLAQRVKGALDKAIDAAKMQGNEPNDEDLKPVVTKAVIDNFEEVESRPLLTGLSKASRETARREIGKISQPIIAEIFGNLPMSMKAKTRLRRFAGEFAIRSVFTDFRSGIVIAGFGKGDALPRLQAFRVEGRVRGKPRYSIESNAEVTPTNGAIVIPFAQQETVRTFMHGISDDLATYIRESTGALFEGFVDAVKQAVGTADSNHKAVLEALEKATPKMLDALFDEWRNRESDHWHPVVTNVATLPKDELAAMAEAFVNLTKFRRRVAMERETVGGPIDVAIITPGDGFVWIKRKHYFDPQLNPRVMNRLQQG